jgi:hypothetical protein
LTSKQINAIKLLSNTELSLTSIRKIYICSFRKATRIVLIWKNKRRTSSRKKKIAKKGSRRSTMKFKYSHPRLKRIKTLYFNTMR